MLNRKRFKDDIPVDMDNEIIADDTPHTHPAKQQHTATVGPAICHAITANLMNAMATICNADKIDSDALITVFDLLDRNIDNYGRSFSYCFFNENIDFNVINDSDTLKIFMEEYGCHGGSRTIPQEDL